MEATRCKEDGKQHVLKLVEVDEPHGEPGQNRIAVRVPRHHTLGESDHLERFHLPNDRTTALG